MPKFSGLFDSFDNLEKINVENVASFLKNPPQLISLENYLANRILYPQTLPLTEENLEIDLAILREALKLTISPHESTLLGENPFFNKTLRKIMKILSRNREALGQANWKEICTLIASEPVLSSLRNMEFFSDQAIRDMLEL